MTHGRNDDIRSDVHLDTSTRCSSASDDYPCEEDPFRSEKPECQTGEGPADTLNGEEAGNGCWEVVVYSPTMSEAGCHIKAVVTCQYGL